MIDRIVLDAIVYILPGRKHPRLRLHGYEYNVHKQEQSRTRWRCTQESRSKCAAVLYTTGNSVEVRRGHNHPAATGNDDSTMLSSRPVKVFYNF